LSQKSWVRTAPPEGGTTNSFCPSEHTKNDVTAQGVRVPTFSFGCSVDWNQPDRFERIKLTDWSQRRFSAKPFSPQ